MPGRVYWYGVAVRTKKNVLSLQYQYFHKENDHMKMMVLSMKMFHFSIVLGFVKKINRFVTRYVSYLFQSTYTYISVAKFEVDNKKKTLVLHKIKLKIVPRKKYKKKTIAFINNLVEKYVNAYMNKKQASPKNKKANIYLLCKYILTSRTLSLFRIKFQ